MLNKQICLRCYIDFLVTYCNEEQVSKSTRVFNDNWERKLCSCRRSKSGYFFWSIDQKHPEDCIYILEQVLHAQ